MIPEKSILSETALLLSIGYVWYCSSSAKSGHFYNVPNILQPSYFNFMGLIKGTWK